MSVEKVEGVAVLASALSEDDTVWFGAFDRGLNVDGTIGDFGRVVFRLRFFVGDIIFLFSILLSRF